MLRDLYTHTYKVVKKRNYKNCDDREIYRGLIKRDYIVNRRFISAVLGIIQVYGISSGRPIGKILGHYPRCAANTPQRDQ